MAAQVYGISYVFGVSATSPTASQIVGYSLSKSDANVNTVEDSTGAIVTRRNDDQQDVLELDLKVTASFSEPAIASVLTVVDSGVPSIAGEYQIMSSTQTGANKDFKTFKISALKSEYLDVTP